MCRGLARAHVLRGSRVLGERTPMSVRLVSVIIATGCAIAAATACSSPSAPEEVDIKKATQASSVTVQMFDKSGKELGSCSGTLVSKDLVLTAGHCAVGVASWKIDSRSANTKSVAKRAATSNEAGGAASRSRSIVTGRRLILTVVIGS